jgi:hypothetical protein
MESQVIKSVNCGLLGCDALYTGTCRYIKRFRRNVLPDRGLQENLKEKRSRKISNVDSS